MRMRLHLNYTGLVVAACVAASCASSTSVKDRASARIHYDIGVASLGQGDRRGALRELTLAASLNPELAEAHNALGLTYHALDHRQEALGHYEKAVELKPGFSEAHNNLGVLLLDMNRYPEAIKHFSRALEDILYPTPSLAEGNLGWAYYKGGDVAKGLRHLRNAVASNPKFCRGYGWLAEIEIERGDAEQLVAYCRRFEKHCLQDPALAKRIPRSFVAQMKFNLGTGYQKLGELDAARKAFSSCAGNDQPSDLQAKCSKSLGSLN